MSSDINVDAVHDDMGCGCLRLEQDTIAIFPTALTRPAGYFNSYSLSSPRVVRKRVFYGGPRSTAIITCIPIPDRMFIPPGTRDLFTAI
jgi:hypothetical protein